MTSGWTYLGIVKGSRVPPGTGTAKTDGAANKPTTSRASQKKVILLEVWCNVIVAIFASYN
jgi:hypothetical protein